MRLKCIKLAGFKSFVDATTVQFPGNMCAIVGPNGCGKSNVIDAVRWVMGEGSAKNLRGEQMSDVIFNGSVNRQPVHQAFIELVFDNQDGSLGGEYASYAEISIRRQITREGQSEYFLNGGKCRRRDITGIFLGTGLGPRSYAIIEQGTISRLIESKPEELRVFIEEAAGISRYRERRKETESRMRRTVENLDRLNDLREELDRQLRHLQRQSQAAEKYGEYKQEERQLKAQLQALQWRSLEGEVSRSRHGVGGLDVKLESVVAEQRRVDARIEELRVTHTGTNDAFNEVQGRYYNQGSEVTRIEQTIKHQQERSRQLAEDLSQTGTDMEEARRHLEEDRASQREWQGELETIAPELERLQTAETATSAALLEVEEAMQTWQTEWDEFNQRAAAPLQQSEVQQSRILHLEQSLQNVERRVGGLEQELGQLAGPPEDAADGQLGEQVASLDSEMNRHRQRSAELLEQVGAAGDRRNALAGELDSARGKLQTLRGRQASLEALQQAAAGGGEAVDSWLEQRQLQRRPRLLEQIQVDVEWQRAVETVLGDSLSAVCIEDMEALAADIAHLSEGRLMLLESGPTGSASPGSLAEKVSGPADVAALLGDVLVAEDLTSALRHRAGLQAHQSLVTRDGIWVGSGWVRVNRPPKESESSGAIARQRELEQLAAQREDSEQVCARLERELDGLVGSIKTMERERHDAQEAMQTAARQHAKLGAQLSAEQARSEQITQRRESLNRDIEESRAQFEREKASLAEARSLLSEAMDAMERDSGQREELQSTRDEVRARLDEARQKARHDKDQAHQKAMQHQTLQSRLDSVVQSMERTETQLQQLTERQQSLKLNIDTNDAPLDELERELKAALKQRLAVESELGEARAAVDAAEHDLREAEGQRAETEQRAATVRSELETLKLEHQGLVVQQETLEKQLREGGHEVSAVLEGLPEDASEEEWQGSLERMHSRIERLGAINLAAIDEFSQQSERKQYLDSQNEDLETALKTLESAIRKIDRETRNRFKETFDQVNNSLGDLFPQMFGGGSACLEMTGEDLLNTGITIMAHPPGKKNTTIHLLSGGEKALTAIALVFSIFRLNPAPFCMLDEVDAPLDDANTLRYARMVADMSDQVQFIFITHNKITMEMTDHLMGITMQEPGVSRLVTVDIDEATKLAAN